MADENEEIHFAMLKAAGLALGILPIFAGVAIGIKDSVIGICQSAEIKLDLSLTILPMVFTSASIIYGMIVFFSFRSKKIETYEQGFVFLTATMFSGVGGFLTSYAVGKIGRSACVVKAQQKRFTTQFFLMMIFAELIGIFALIMTIVHGSSIE